MRTISHYDLIAKLGEGGMGVVWKARDQRLDRLVAIKFLPVERTADPDRKRRFAQEARAASALNHPRIITIYDIDHADGADFIVMEYVPGKTLEQLIPSKGMKVEEALRSAIQIADALAAAHAAGIVHRDLKPANVIVSENGQVKVLDFGLAKLQEEDPSAREVDNTRTIADVAKTQDGTIVGTTCYMSPEQADGRKVDARSDIFSFGAVLYEMLTGKRAFPGDSKMSTLAAVMRADPVPIAKLVDGIPRELVRIVQRCLRKNPEDRAQSMADLRIALKDLKEESESGLLAPPPSAPQKSSKGWWIAAGLAAVILAAGGAYLATTGRGTPEPQLRATLLTSYPGLENSPSFSPDGNQVAFGWNGEQEDNWDIYVKMLGPGKPLRLTTNAARDINPSWSPDGRWIAFVRNNSVLLVPPIGGTEHEVGQFHFPTGTNAVTEMLVIGWSPDSRWLVFSSREEAAKPLAVYLVSVETGEKRRLTQPPQGLNGDYFGAISPDGKLLAFARTPVLGTPAMTESDVYTVALGSNYTPQGEPARATFDGVLIGGIAWTADSREIVYSSARAGVTSLWRKAISGKQPPVKLAVGDNGVHPAISRDGRRLAFAQLVPSDVNIWRASLSDPAAQPSEVVASSRPELSPRYSSDGRKIAFSSERSGFSSIWVCDADGHDPVQVTNMRASGSPAWSPDGQRLAFDSITDGKWQIHTVSAQGGKTQQLTFGVPHTRPYWSHDGHWIYSTANGAIQKIPSGGGDPVTLPGTEGGANAYEAPDGQTLYFQKTYEMWRVGTDGTGAREVFPDPAVNIGIAVTADGIYYAARQRPSTLSFFSFATGKSRVIRTVEKLGGLGMDVSPDQKWILYPQSDTPASADLMLVDPFR